MFVLKKILIFILFYCSTVASQEVSEDLFYPIATLWLWPQASQVYFLDPETKSSAVFYLLYNSDKTRIEKIDYEFVGQHNFSFDQRAKFKSLISFLGNVKIGDDLKVFLEGPRQVDPLGPQPTEDESLYNKGLLNQPVQDLKQRKRFFKIKSFLRKRFSGGRQTQHKAVFPEISWREMRGIIKSDLTQDQIDFEIFREMILKMAKSNLRDSKKRSSALSCKTLF